MGGGGHGHGHGLPKLPDWKSYKVEDAPELLVVQRALAAKGLKDPWARNEVWKFNWEARGGTRWQIFKRIMFRGAPLGFGLAIITAFAEHYVTKPYLHHGHGHDEHQEESHH